LIAGLYFCRGCRRFSPSVTNRCGGRRTFIHFRFAPKATVKHPKRDLSLRANRVQRGDPVNKSLMTSVCATEFQGIPILIGDVLLSEIATDHKEVATVDDLKGIPFTSNADSAAIVCNSFRMIILRLA
jgi:hypothetical protein